MTIKRTITTVALLLVTLTGAASAEPVCQSYVGTGCYWMENTSGNYCWVPSSWTPSFQDCFAADSCDGGLGRSGGGCYKWAAGSEAPRASWRRASAPDVARATARPLRRHISRHRALQLVARGR